LNILNPLTSNTPNPMGKWLPGHREEQRRAATLHLAETLTGFSFQRAI
jgi:hypothetical protein